MLSIDTREKECSGVALQIVGPIHRSRLVPDAALDKRVASREAGERICAE